MLSRSRLALDCCAVNDKHILITGATNGIGLAAAEALWQLRLAVLKDAKLDVASDQAIAKEAEAQARS
jgi:NAD(P)-dependent dehydrogenase (short-subunit alcohol dehydrogenase family)